MPDLSSLLPSLVNAGGVVGFAIFLVIAIIKGWLVPGFLHNREVARSDKAWDQVDQLSKAFAATTAAWAAALDRLTDEVRSRDRSR